MCAQPKTIRYLLTISVRLVFNTLQVLTTINKDNDSHLTENLNVILIVVVMKSRLIVFLLVFYSALFGHISRRTDNSEGKRILEWRERLCKRSI